MAAASVAVPTVCPNENEVLALVRGSVQADSKGALQSHVDTCPSCQELFAVLLGGTEVPLLDSGARSSRRGADMLSPGAMLGRYRIRDVVGAGAMGIVYLAEDPNLQRAVAIKVLRNQNEEASARLLREAQALARLSHPNVIVVHEVGTVGEQVFMAMEFVEGSSLTAWLAHEQRSTEEILEHFAQAGRGLSVAHEAELVHRDFKPDNVLVGKDGRVRVVDFGLAREGMTLTSVSRESLPDATDIGRLMTLTQTGAFIGTPAYMAPEQYEGRRANARTDQFSFAVSLFEALYGKRPHVAKTLHELSVAVRTGDLHIPKTSRRIPRPVERALLRALDVDATKRFSTMRDFLAALAAPEATRLPVFGIAAAIAAAALAAGTFGYATRKAGATAPPPTAETAPSAPIAPLPAPTSTSVFTAAPALTTSMQTAPISTVTPHGKPAASASPPKSTSVGATPQPATTADLFDTVR